MLSILFNSILGMALLIVGAELLVRGASRLAAAFGISPLIIGLTVVAFGTSAPELAVSAKAALAGQGDIAIGNVVGSNILNILLILGLSALIIPLTVHAQLVRLDVPIMIAASVVTFLLSLDGTIGRVDGAILFAGLIAYTIFLIRQSRRESLPIKQEIVSATESRAHVSREVPTWTNIVFVIGGLGLLVVGAGALVSAAVSMAKSLGVSELVISLTIVAAGTSLPEIATTIMAALRGQRDIAVGNVVGSNIFNLLSILGISALLRPLEVPPTVLAQDLPVMLGVALICLPILFSGQKLSRIEGTVLMVAYIAYTGYLIMQAKGDPELPMYRGVLLVFGIPMLLLILALSAIRDAWLASRTKRVSE